MKLKQSHNILKNRFRSASCYDRTLLEFMETKTKEEQYIVPENIARDLKNEFVTV